MCDIQIRSHLISVVLLLLLVLVLGCGEVEDTPQPITQPPPETPTLTPQEIAKIALQSTVFLQIKKPDENITGSGFVVDDNLVVTSYHVVVDMLDGSTVKLVQETIPEPILAVVATDAAHDLAIIRVSRIYAPALPLGDSDTVEVADTVYVVGNPKGYAGTFSVGVVSAIRLNDPVIKDKAFQMTAPISHGSSGGPVMSKHGEVIAILGGQEFDTQNLNFAVSVNHLKALLKTIQ